MQNIYWIRDIEPLRLAIMPRPRGGDWLETELATWKRAEISTVVSLLCPDEIVALELAEEEAMCLTHGVEFLSFPIQDRGVPHSKPEFLAFAKGLAARVRSGQSVAIHCRAGIGRSSLTAACTLIDVGVPAAEAFVVLSRARGMTVPDTPAQMEWFESLSDPRANAEG